jgi:hypothetical protein
VELIDRRCNLRHLLLSMSVLKKSQQVLVCLLLEALRLAVQVMEILQLQQVPKFSTALALLAMERTHHTNG